MSTLNEEERGEQGLDKVRQRLSEAVSKATHRPFDTRAKVPTDCQRKGDKTLGPAICTEVRVNGIPTRALVDTDLLLPSSHWIMS